MAPTRWRVALVVVSLTATVAGVVDAARHGYADLVAVFVIVALPLVALLFTLETGRPSVPLRRDLVGWLRDRAALAGEPLGVAADRALDAQRTMLREAPVEDVPAQDR